MAFWSKKTWEDCRVDRFPVRPRQLERVDESGYRLSVGEEIVRTSQTGQKVERIESNQTIFIEPGQFAFILTEEVVDIPLDVIGFISVRAGIKFFGLVNVSGFHVDPGYRGKLIFAVFNAGPTRIPLRRKQEIFNLWLANVDRALPEENRPKRGYDHIPPDVIAKIGDGHLTAYQLEERVSELEDLVRDLKLWRNIIGGVVAVLVALAVSFIAGVGVEYAKNRYFPVPVTVGGNGGTGK